MAPTLPAASAAANVRSGAGVRRVLVTGAAKRLGREIALALAAAGWQVAVHYRNSFADAIKTVADCAAATSAIAGFVSENGVNGGHAAFAADFDDEASTRGLLPQVLAQFGRLDAVVNSASTFELDRPESFSYAAMQMHLRANTGAAIVLAQGLAEHVAARQEAVPADAVVVNLLDQKLWNLNPDFFSYTLSKAALHAANTMLALALAPRVRVVGVAPGLTLTSTLLSAEQFAARQQLSPLGRSSTAAEVAAAVRFALDNAALTGTTLLVDGGQHLLRLERDFSCM